eukprot:1434917-Pyramimonas_sp.AAC.1
MHIGPRQARTSGGHEGHTYMGPERAIAGPLSAENEPRRAARGPRMATAGRRRTCVWGHDG